MAIQVRVSGQQESHGAPADEDYGAANVFHDEVEEGELEDEPKPKSDGRIKPGEVRNRYGRKGKPKKEKTFEEMMVDGLTKFVDVPQRDGSIHKMRIIQYLIESTIAQALKGNVYQRLKFIHTLNRNGDLARVDGFLQRDWEAEEERRYNETRAWAEALRAKIEQGDEYRE